MMFAATFGIWISMTDPDVVDGRLGHYLCLSIQVR